MSKKKIAFPTFEAGDVVRLNGKIYRYPNGVNGLTEKIVLVEDGSIGTVTGTSTPGGNYNVTFELTSLPVHASRLMLLENLS